MTTLPKLYGHSLALLTDLYQLTMGNGYFLNGMADREAVYQLTFRTHPFRGEYAIACGLSYVVDWLRELRFREDDLQYLAGLQGADGKPLFGEDYLGCLRELRFTCDVDAVEEGTVVFAHEPLLRVQGPILQCQIIETALLNIINFQTLVATKASRLVRATGGEPVLEFGLRRAQGIDGGLSASRAAFVGGCTATSNVLAGRLFDIPVRGTHAHSWVMAFDDEMAAFESYGRAMPNNCVFLVDTFDTIEGVKKAIQVGRRLRERGHALLGIRLDSGDLAALSREARRLLDDAGFNEASIVASNDLDEYEVQRLKDQQAKVNVWGVGTRLATAYDQPALGGVYKLAAIRDVDGQWRYKIKLSEEPIKVPNPGIQQVRRLRRDDQYVADVIFDEPTGVGARDFRTQQGAPSVVPAATSEHDLLVPIFRRGDVVYTPPSVQEARQRSQDQLRMFDDHVTRIAQPKPYPVCLDGKLWQMKRELMDAAKEPKS